MPINASYEYLNAEKAYNSAEKLEDKIYWLEELIKTAPKHKGSENLLSQLRVRLKKFKGQSEKNKKKGGGKKGIRKDGFQFVLVGKANSGKSSLLKTLTNANPLIADYPYSTRVPELGTVELGGLRAQMVDLPSIGSESFDIGLVNNADCLILVVENLDDLKDVEENCKRSRSQRIVVVSKSDLLNEHELRKLNAQLKSKRIDGVVVSSLTTFGLDKLKEKIFSKMGVIRIYTKEPGKEKAKLPMVLKEGSTIKDAAESILKGFSKKVKETHLTGPSSKFSNQRVGLGHVLKDRDIVEFHTF